MNNSVLLAPSILSADFSRLAEGIAFIEKNGGDWVHIDVMDGSFVPNISFGQGVTASLRPLTKLPFDVHLMINNPENHIDTFAQAGADYITFHYENVIHHHRLTERIHQLGKKVGISIVPSTAVSAIVELLPFVDLVLIMTVNPGFGGQKMIPECLKKITCLKTMREEKHLSYKLSVDGGVTADTIGMVAQAGSDIAVSGSAFFSGTLQRKK